VHHEGLDTLFVTVAQCPVEELYTGFTYVKLKDIAPVIGTNGEKEYKILKFSTYYESAKLTGDQAD